VRLLAPAAQLGVRDTRRWATLEQRRAFSDSNRYPESPDKIEDECRGVGGIQTRKTALQCGF
jgi:hypothetical protein